MKKIRFMIRSVLFCMMIFLFSIIISIIFPIKGYSQGAGFTLDFDGVDDYIMVPSSSGDELNPQTNITVECWVNLNETPSSEHQSHLVTKFNSYRLIIGTSGLPMFSIYSGGTWYSSEGVTIIQKNKWYHVAGTYDGSRLRIFVNGVQEKLTNLGTSPLMQQNEEPVRIGASDPTCASCFTNGKMDGVRIWNTNRVPGQIQNAMNQKVLGTTSNLVGLWHLDDGSGTTADDLTSYGNDGTLTNMDPLSDWMASNAPIGDASVFKVSANITETPACAVDVTFGTDADAPGTGFSLASMQINALPNNLNGLLLQHANLYWELWSEDIDFDGDFTAAVNFHYDNVTGITDESLLLLFRRDSASASGWSICSGFNVFSNDGGSSTISDGLGYVQMNLSETSSGGFGGQYILCWQNRPVVGDIPDQTVDEGSTFATVSLNDYVSDADDPDSAIIWTYSGISDLTVTIDENRVATISIPDVNWFGSETITFTATDIYGMSDTDSATFNVASVNDLPVVSGIPDQAVDEGSVFATIILDDYVSDVEDPDSVITWSYAGNNWLTVTIDMNRMVTLDIPGINWFGIDTIIFTATDKDGGSDNDTVIFTVTSVNDLPVVTDIPDQAVNEGSVFTTVSLDNYVSDVEDQDSEITWDYSGNTELTVTIDVNRVVTIGIPDVNWYGSETITFTATDKDGGTVSNAATFTVTSVNDAPVVLIKIPDTSGAVLEEFIFIFNENTFGDLDPDDLLSYSAALTTGDLPDWLSFNNITRTFSGTPASSDSGLYNIQVTATDQSLVSVTDTFRIYIIGTTGIPDFSEKLEVNTYPNPFSGLLYIDLVPPVNADIELKIFTLKGQLIWDQKYQDQSRNGRLTVNLSHLKKDIYILKIVTESATAVKQIILQ